jgi:cytochrome P450
LVNLVLKVTKARPAPLAREYVFKTCGNRDLGENTLLYKLQNSKDYFQPVDMAAECMDHMAAGIDTTGDALCFLMYQISLPECWHVQGKLFQEFEQNKDKPLDDLEYLDAVVKEGLRCFPPIPMSQPRYVPKEGRTIDGYYIPEGTIVSCQAYSVHRLNEIIYVKGDEFIPERWLEREQNPDMNRLFFSFGTGGRGCTGRQ